MIFLTFGLGLGALGYRGARLHTHHDQKLTTLANNQYTETIHPLPLRGNIYDRHGNELAISVPTSSLAAHPHLVGDKNTLARQLAGILQTRPETIRKKLAIDKKFVWIKRQLAQAEIEKIRGLDEAGLKLVKEARRYYPNRDLAGQILGAAGYDGEALGGVELFYDKHLRASRKSDVAYRDARGEIFDSEDDEGPASDVSHLYLTLHRHIQYVAETELASAAHRLQIKSGTVVAMNPKTGEIVAMASYPAFNPNTYTDSHLSCWKNLSVTDSFEPGSTFKVVTVAAALEEGIIEPDEKIFCENGGWKIGNITIHDHEKYGKLTVEEIIKFSSNIGVSKISGRIGKKNLYNTIRRFGFGQTTDIDFPGEASGIVRQPETWQPVDLATISFGQGISATALQITSAFATIANGGNRMKPYLLDKIVKSDGSVVFSAEPVSLGQVITPETANAMTRILEEVTEEGGTGRLAAIDGYRIAGKTGTAQKYDSKLNIYSKNQHYASFVGFAPAEDPQIVIFVGLDSPKTKEYGGETAAPIFKNIMKAALYQLKIAPNQTSLPIFEATEGPDAKPLSFVKPEAPKVLPDKKVVPDFSGLSVSQAISLGEGQEMEVDIEGVGIAYHQRPAPGQGLEEGEMCRVYFREGSGG